MRQVGAKARAVVEEAKGVDEEEDNGKFKQVPNHIFWAGIIISLYSHPWEIFTPDMKDTD